MKEPTYFFTRKTRLVMNYFSTRHFGELYFVLEKIDMVLAKIAHERHCQHCGGPLDVANYGRKIRGNGLDKPVIKYGLCCRQEGCRKRATVESVRFVGGFIYSSMTILLACYLLNGSQIRFKNILRRFNLNPRTLKRWNIFWSEIFEKTAFWKEHRVKINLNLDGSVLQRIFGSFKNQKEQNDWFLDFLHFFIPLKQSDYLKVQT